LPKARAPSAKSSPHGPLPRNCECSMHCVNAPCPSAEHRGPVLQKKTLFKRPLLSADFRPLTSDALRFLARLSTIDSQLRKGAWLPRSFTLSTLPCSPITIHGSLFTNRCLAFPLPTSSFIIHTSNFFRVLLFSALSCGKPRSGDGGGEDHRRSRDREFKDCEAGVR
jgi:hypothetical protein